MSLPQAAKDVENRIFVERVLNTVILFGDCNDFCPIRTSESNTASPRWSDWSREGRLEIKRNLGF